MKINTDKKDRLDTASAAYGLAAKSMRKGKGKNTLVATTPLVEKDRELRKSGGYTPVVGHDHTVPAAPAGANQQ